jgi:hypothetical protein
VSQLDVDPGYVRGRPTKSLLTQHLTEYLARPEDRQFVRDVLSAPITHRRGTMHFLLPFAASTNPHVSAHLGKTGTPVNDEKLATDKFITGGLISGGNYYSYLVMVRAPNPAKFPLGRDLSARDFGPLVTTLLNQIDGVQASPPAVLPAIPGLRELPAHGGPPRRIAQLDRMGSAFD